ncbi:MAG: bifunctional diaminohydroxyphosphoribosylaminopyrimidine deaminase/5-amino-6-(5-phosphoribosylamino)uracil reductase RibD [Pseudomonadota bacterium]
MHQTQHSSDVEFMQRALRLAQSVRGHVWPNPPVGCVIVKDNSIIAEAATHPGGRPHAERKALDIAGDAAHGSTLYVTLEPCCHWGKTPPCADGIIEAGVARVVCSIQDPDPRVNGGGFAKLKNAGLELSVGAGKDQAEALLSGFFNRIRLGVPELVAYNCLPQDIPDGVDAVLSYSQDGWTLVSRTSKFAQLPKSADSVMRWMGQLGLTTVALSKDDPLWRQDVVSQRHTSYLKGSASDTSALGIEI